MTDDNDHCDHFYLPASFTVEGKRTVIDVEYVYCARCRQVSKPDW